jgi:lipoprotein-anchoring transpeptidase ErfK/SrfK
MLRPVVRYAWLSSTLLATLALPAGAQSTEIARDSSSGAVHSDGARAERAGGNWFSALLRRIARRSDDSLAVNPSADTLAASLASDTASESDRAVPLPRAVKTFKSRKDSLAWSSAKRVAERSSGYRIVVDINAKQLYVIDRTDTLRIAPAATAMNATLSYGGRTWRFETPRGVRVVRGKDRDPVWTPPEWHFAEVALEHGLKLRSVSRGQSVRLKDGTLLQAKGDEMGVVRPGSKRFVPLVLDEHIVFDNTLFIPASGTKHRSIQGELGHYRLDMGDGYLLHGTPYTKSIGAAVTHGCVRLLDEDIEWLFENVPIGTRVYIY